ncbi:hypothetical protein [Cellulomonas fimi]|uniref:Phosphoenolpyruvate-protein phosphotransferase n=1 Tax=Cellulomonas fimi (strain ATCC 484 / DSM 20113 / JCM 1341 / CCUG 24087 / LMG 16345 / NBRC 15513 / NCIMB 8980 / NCTC 7547 / NRS-133) TaxID=590998 RepID=F4H0I9_CELFA|nr:hypothetical protein [Cellulomonas fimi]AEE47358.1 phosphoenolpyruvate-protein phosphotransferase [Cellulomonas fimi ATCC 484]NNH05812.1 hypothetical protein [Cellulomonas fimi]VEH36019.1 Uncharacterised protein [Cellulomonas fimi]
MTAALHPLDGALRARLDEQDWAAARHDVEGLPAWAQVLPTTREGEPVDLALAADAEVDAEVRAAVTLGASALVEVEVAAAGTERAVLAVAWTDGQACASLVRGVDVTPGAGAQGAVLRPGVEVSAFGVDALLDEVLRLLPDAPVLVEAAEAVVPEELTVALAQAIRTGDRSTVDALCAALGVPEPPPVVDAAVRGLSGTLTLSARSRGRDDVSVGTWLRCDAGWVELARTADGMIRHTPRSRDDIARVLLSDLTGRLSAALRAAGDGGPLDGGPVAEGPTGGAGGHGPAGAAGATGAAGAAAEREEGDA